MRLYPVRPDTTAVTDHFKKMSRGELPRTSRSRRQVGFGMVGSRLSIGGHTMMKPRKRKEPVVVKETTAVEAGVQQAKSAIASATAQRRGTKRKAPSSSGQSKKRGRGKKKTQKEKKKKGGKSKPRKKKQKKDNFS